MRSALIFRVACVLLLPCVALAFASSPVDLRPALLHQMLTHRDALVQTCGSLSNHPLQDAHLKESVNLLWTARLELSSSGHAVFQNIKRAIEEDPNSLSFSDFEQ